MDYSDYKEYRSLTREEMENNIKKMLKHHKSSLRKISDIPLTCRSENHNPPGNMCLSPGLYEWTCPDCGEKITFVVNSCSFSISNKGE